MKNSMILLDYFFFSTLELLILEVHKFKHVLKSINSTTVSTIVIRISGKNNILLDKIFVLLLVLQSFKGIKLIIVDSPFVAYCSFIMLI